tara:strand:- start:51 stop:425 length:375 start_codon:yes stop_codon:yes gene_type:complete
MGTYANDKLVMLYFQTGDGVNDGADEGYAAPLKNFRGFRFIADTDAIEMQFDSMLGTGADIAAVDKVVLNITAAKQHLVIADITAAINGLKYGDGFVTIADDATGTYVSSNITTCGAITVTAAA